MGPSNELPCIHVAQGASKLPEVKVRDTKKSRTRMVQIGQSGRIFFQTSNFDIWQFCSLLSYKVHSTSFESLDTVANEFSLKKEFKSTFRLFFSPLNSVYLVRVPFLTGIALYVFNVVLYI